MKDLDFCSGGNVLRLLRSSVFKGRRTGGRSGLTLVLSAWFLSPFEPVSHSLRWLRSRKRRIIPLPAILLRRWHAARSEPAASLTPRCCLARSTQRDRVTFSSSFSSPFRPWIVRAHLRRWTSRPRVYKARPTAACSTWRLRAGKDTR